MANSIIMPKTGMAMTEGTLLEWKIKPGDPVRKGDVVAEIETDKSTMELESDYDGVILAVLARPGEIVPVTQVIAWIGTPGEKIPDSPGPAPAAPPNPAAHQPRGAVEPQDSPEPAPPNPAAQVPAGRIKATPLARRLAEERGISLTGLSPSGASGEIRAADLDRSSGGKATPLARRMAEDRGLSWEELRGSGHGGKVFSADLDQAVLLGGVPRPGKRLALSNIKRTTGRRMLESCQTIPMVTENAKADVTRMLLLRSELNEKAGLKITINDFVLAAVVKALLLNPGMNCYLDGRDLVYLEDINLGLAVATGRGLVVPVLRQAQNLSLVRLSQAAAAAALLGREGRLKPEDMEGGTFSVSNVGIFGITSFTPIINPPEAGILGVCAVEDVLALAGEKVIVKKVMGLSLTFDHRIADGAEASALLKSIKDHLESPVLLLV
ncbi:MAG: 2-oxo acid dehydrogenase subunit E2 [Spirochaetales bacterium]|jgi:pyruvate dehydrogenase E2 component (dihydrolipoamide acetyltransferase)|nr:2-oxo acid dehydrogenase subunit E2 [Spirochaetales bacterium]